MPLPLAVPVALAAAATASNVVGSGKQAKAAREQTKQAGSAQVFDSTNPILRQLAGQQTDFLSGVFGGNNPFAPLQSPLNGVATGAVQNAIGAPQAGAGALAAPQNALQQLLGGGGADLSQFGALGQLGNVQANAPQFGELQNPFANMGAVNPGEAVVSAAQPIFQRNLQNAQTQLSNAAPNRFSSAFAQQGQGIAQQALQDFNLFAANALQQGQQLQTTQQNQALNFLLGARGLQQDSAMGGAQLGAQVGLGNQQAQLGGLQALLGGMLQNAQIGQSGVLGAAQGLGQLGSLQGQQQNDFFSRLLGAGQLGLQQSQTNINPILALMQAGLQYAQPADLNTIVGATNVRGLPPSGGYSQNLIPQNAMNPLALFGGR